MFQSSINRQFSSPLFEEHGYWILCLLAQHTSFGHVKNCFGLMERWLRFLWKVKMVKITNQDIDDIYDVINFFMEKTLINQKIAINVLLFKPRNQWRIQFLSGVSTLTKYGVFSTNLWAASVSDSLQMSGVNRIDS